METNGPEAHPVSHKSAIRSVEKTGRTKVEDIELCLILEAIYLRYGHDFRQYSRVTMMRRVQHALEKSDCANLTEMIHRLLVDEPFFQWLLGCFSITVTQWFRDPLFYRALRKSVIPYLRTFPFFKIWHAGCATGEEVYSLAVILKVEGLYERATIFATDFNDDALLKAKNGIYPVKDIKEAAPKYRQAGGTDSLTEMIHANYNSAIVAPDLKKNIVFANHNLVTDGVFGEMHLILCRNVLIYFDKALQNRMYHLFTNSLIQQGFLCLGNRENLEFSEVRDVYKVTDQKQKVFRKRTD